ncbi:MAG: helix-turn-helix domain-containing protein [Actinopolymorphaceae bacterium]
MTNVISFPGLPDATSAPVYAGRDTATVGRAVYTVKETAELLSLSLGSTYSLVRSGQIPAIKLGGRWVIPKRRLHEWLDSQTDASRDITAEFQPATPRRRR